jgi:hypothetical protein
MELKRLPEDFKEFLSFLKMNAVKYLLIDGWRTILTSITLLTILYPQSSAGFQPNANFCNFGLCNLEFVCNL